MSESLGNERMLRIGHKVLLTNSKACVSLKKQFRELFEKREPGEGRQAL